MTGATPDGDVRADSTWARTGQGVSFCAGGPRRPRTHGHFRSDRQAVAGYERSGPETTRKTAKGPRTVRSTAWRRQPDAPRPGVWGHPWGSPRQSPETPRRAKETSTPPGCWPPWLGQAGAPRRPRSRPFSTRSTALPTYLMLNCSHRMWLVGIPSLWNPSLRDVIIAGGPHI